MSSYETIETEDLDLPDSKEPSNVFATNVTVKFTTSGFMKDLGQTTVPFLDTQDVSMSIAVPLSGVGLYYKYRHGFTGYIGIKLKTFTFINHMDDYADDPINTAQLIYEQLMGKRQVEH